MKTRFAIAAVATIAAFSSIGSAVAGELYSPSEGSYTPVAVTPNPVAVYDGGGELHLAVERQTARFEASDKPKPPTNSIYALGGELYFPAELRNGSPFNANLAE